jgi:hypothetical protein
MKFFCGQKYFVFCLPIVGAWFLSVATMDVSYGEEYDEEMHN